MAESLCARCAKGEVTCCRGSLVFLTLGDMERIGKAAPEGGFWEYSPPCNPETAAYDPAWKRTFGKDGRRRVLVRGEGGDCFFLTPNGCRLSLEERPLICRLYPFDYNQDCIKGVYGPLCPRPETDNPALLLALLGMNRETAEPWRAMLYREIEEEFPEGGE